MNMHFFKSGFTTHASGKERRLIFAAQPENFEKKANDLQQQLDAEKAKTSKLEGKIDALMTTVDLLNKKLDAQQKTGMVMAQPYAPTYMPRRGFGPAPRMMNSPYMRRSVRVRPRLINYSSGCQEMAKNIGRKACSHFQYSPEIARHIERRNGKTYIFGQEQRQSDGSIRTGYDANGNWAEMKREKDGSYSVTKILRTPEQFREYREQWERQSYITDNGIRMRGNTQDQNEQFKNRRNGRKYRGGIRQASISDFSDPMSSQASYSVVGGDPYKRYRKVQEWADKNRVTPEMAKETRAKFEERVSKAQNFLAYKRLNQIPSQAMFPQWEKFQDRKNEWRAQKAEGIQSMITKGGTIFMWRETSKGVQGVAIGQDGREVPLEKEDLAKARKRYDAIPGITSATPLPPMFEEPQKKTSEKADTKSSAVKIDYNAALKKIEKKQDKK